MNRIFNLDNYVAHVRNEMDDTPTVLLCHYIEIISNMNNPLENEMKEFFFTCAKYFEQAYEGKEHIELTDKMKINIYNYITDTLIKAIERTINLHKEDSYPKLKEIIFK